MPRLGSGMPIRSSVASGLVSTTRMRVPPSSVSVSEISTRVATCSSGRRHQKLKRSPGSTSSTQPSRSPMRRSPPGTRSISASPPSHSASTTDSQASSGGAGSSICRSTSWTTNFSVSALPSSMSTSLGSATDRLRYGSSECATKELHYPHPTPPHPRPEEASDDTGPDGHRADLTRRAQLRHLLPAAERADHLHRAADRRPDREPGGGAAPAPPVRRSRQGHLDVHQLARRGRVLGARDLRHDAVRQVRRADDLLRHGNVDGIA